MVLIDCNQSAKDLAGDSWGLGTLKEISTDNFWIWEKKSRIGFDVDVYLGLETFVDFEKELWFELGKYVWRNYQSIY